MTTTKKILIIEDNVDIRENLEELLELSDYQIISAADGAIGIEKTYSEMPDFIISDISMPVKDGYQVFETLRPHLKANKVPFIFLTASAQEKDVAAGRTSGADAYIVKPFHSEELLTLINQLLTNGPTNTS